MTDFIEAKREAKRALAAVAQLISTTGKYGTSPEQVKELTETAIELRKIEKCLRKIQ